MLGSDIQRGLLPNDEPMIGAMVRNICYFNAARHFGFNVPQNLDAAGE
jgi:glucuronate isomerase